MKSKLSAGLTVNMLAKRSYPMLNREQRRHPARLYRSMFAGGKAAANHWLIAGLMQRAGIKPVFTLEHDV